MSIRWLRSILALSAAAVVAAGCGGGNDGGDAGSGPGTGSTDGKALFTSSCGGCHVLQAAGTSGSVGPSLDERKPSREDVLTAIKNGPGVMPENLYEGAQAEAVADYVASSAGG